MILLIDNYDSFTYNLVQRLGEIDPATTIHVERNDRITPDQAERLDGGRGPSHLIISPGPCTPKEAGCSAAMIERFAGRIPVLGVCLGHQTIGDMHGMTVTRHAVPMHGKTSPIQHDGQGVFNGLSNPFTATRYHSLVVLAETIPPTTAQGGWAVSAWTDEPIDAANPAGPTRRVVMGLRRVWPEGEHKAPLEGVQFHPESFLTLEGPKLLKNFLYYRNTDAL
ncbi:MAG: aminodeoxychorismate/anthranilate synthase component II [Phycisphaerales bacterium]|nr:aminodeoxychorismate/anthranilate synthase component II [Phycisphaerales bacterium]